MVEVLVGETLPPEIMNELLESAERGGVPVRIVRSGVLETVLTSKTPRPAAAVVRLQPFDPTTLLGDPQGAGPLVLLDRVADPGNVGAIIRSAAGAGARGVIVGEGSADPWGPKAVRASAGAVVALPVTQSASGREVLRAAKDAGWQTGALRASGGEPPDALDLTQPWVFVVGNEAAGPAEDVLAMCDRAITIPTEDVESLNAAVAASVVLFEARRQRAAVARRESVTEALATASHELRGPLTVIRGFASLLATRWHKLGDEERSRMLDALDRESAQVTRLVEHLLDVAQLEAGGLRLRRRQTDLAELVRIQAREIVSRGESLEVEMHEPEQPIEAWVDPDRFSVVVRNLLENVAKHGGGTATVSLSREDTRVVLEVRDRGPGIRPEDAGRIFEMFGRGSTARTGGRGLGLWIARRLAEAHGGAVELVSCGPGAVFRVEVPAEDVGEEAD